MWELNLFGTSIYNIVHWFIFYSFIGWLVESIYMSFCEGKLVNRGFMRGPFCPIYGVGALSAYFSLRSYAENYILLYFFGTFMATTLEYITAKIMYKIFGSIWWDYNNKPFNYKGILCLESSIAWGFYTIFLFAFLHRAAERIVNVYSFETGKIIVSVIMFFYILDFLTRLIETFNFSEIKKRISI